MNFLSHSPIFINMRDIVEIKKIPDWPRIRQFPGYLQNLPSAQECRKNDSLPLIVLKIAYWSLTCQDLRISWGCVKIYQMAKYALQTFLDFQWTYN
jgi:hypothetical protein